MKKEFALGAVRCIFSIFDFDLCLFSPYAIFVLNTNSLHQNMEKGVIVTSPKTDYLYIYINLYQNSMDNV